MLHVRSCLFLFLVPALALSACGGEKPADETAGAVAEAIPSGGYHLAGTYTGNSRQAGDFAQLVLKTDGTYHAKLFDTCVTHPCGDLEQNGRYALFRRGTIAYFEMYTTSSRAIARYQYALQGDTLNVRKLGSTAPFTPMVRSQAAWCAVSQDCALQDLQIGPCAGQYICVQNNICNWQCGPAPEIADQGRKPGAGG